MVTIVSFEIIDHKMTIYFYTSDSKFRLDFLPNCFNFFFFFFQLNVHFERRQVYKYKQTICLFSYVKQLIRSKMILNVRKNIYHNYYEPTQINTGSSLRKVQLKHAQLEIKIFNSEFVYEIHQYQNQLSCYFSLENSSWVSKK